VKTLAVITASGLAVGGLYAGGAFDRGEVYNLSIDDARLRLEGVQFPGQSPAAIGASSTFTEIGNTLTWNIRAGSRPAGSFTATLTSEGPTKTRVLLSYRNGSMDGGYGDRLLSTKFMRSYAETSFYERVDAALDGRPVDPQRAMRAFADNAAAHPEQIREVGQITQDMFADVAEQLQASGVGSADPYSAIRPASPRENMAAATRPSAAAGRPTTYLRDNN
jgi:hypothetical protein